MGNLNKNRYLYVFVNVYMVFSAWRMSGLFFAQ